MKTLSALILKMHTHMLTCMHMLMCMQIWVDYHKTKDCISAVMTVCSDTVKFYGIIPFLYSVGAVH